MPGMDFGTKLRTLMKQAALRQEDVAASFGTSQSVVSGWLNGVMPRVPTLLRLARMLNTSVDYLVDDAQEQPPKPPLTHEEVMVLGVFRALRLTQDEAIRRLYGEPREYAEGAPRTPPPENGLTPEPRRNSRRGG